MAAIRTRYDEQIQRLSAVFDRFKTLKPGDMEGDVDLWREMEDRYGDYFEGCMGAEAIKKRLQDFDLEAASKQLREEIDTGTGQRKARALKRLKVVNAFLTTGNKPEAMVPGHPAGPAPDGAARRWPFRHLRPQRPLPSCDQP